MVPSLAPGRGSNSVLRDVQAFEFDVAIVGTVMPVMDGVFMIERIKELSPATRAILATESICIEAAEFLRAEGINVQCLPAPFEVQELQEFLQTLVLDSEPRMPLSILVVADDPRLVSYVKLLLEIFGHRALGLWCNGTPSEVDAIMHAAYMHFDAAFVRMIIAPPPTYADFIVEGINSVSPDTQLFFMVGAVPANVDSWMRVWKDEHDHWSVAADDFVQILDKLELIRPLSERARRPGGAKLMEALASRLEMEIRLWKWIRDAVRCDLDRRKGKPSKLRDFDAF